jgi:two-component system phosphate regulon sensor histidine kinase PhoR
LGVFEFDTIPKYYEDIVDIAPIGIITFDYLENILIINQQMAFYLNSSPKELVGKNIKAVLGYLNPEILIIIDAVKNKTSIFKEFFSLKFKDKEQFFNIKGSVLPEQGLLIFENVTSIKEYQDQLKSLDQSKDEFISIASHDLRTPITAIRGYLDMVLKEEVGVIATPKMKEYLELARSGSLRLNDLVQDILSVSRIEQKRMRFNLKNVELEPVIENLVKQTQIEAQQKNVNLEFIYPKSKLPLVQIDPNRFTEVLANLIGNALKFTPRGSVIIKTILRNDHVRIDCIDTGIGIAFDKQKQVFKKFFQLDSSTSSQNKGTGLGLYICKMITEKMGGRIGVSSAPQKGSDFFFTIPISGTPLAKRTLEIIQQEAQNHVDQK